MTRPRDQNTCTIFTNNPDIYTIYFPGYIGCYISFQLSGYSRYRFSPSQNDSHTRARQGTSEDEEKNELVTSLKTDRDRGRCREEAPTNPETLPVLSIDPCYLSFCHPDTLPSSPPPSVSPGHPYAANRPSLPSCPVEMANRGNPDPSIPHDFLRSSPVGSRLPNQRFLARSRIFRLFPSPRTASRTMIFRQVGHASNRELRFLIFVHKIQIIHRFVSSQLLLLI